MDANDRTRYRYDKLNEFGYTFFRTSKSYVCVSPGGCRIYSEDINTPGHIRSVIDAAWRDAVTITKGFFGEE